MTIPVIGQEQSVSMDEIIAGLVNFHARVLDYCVDAAQVIVKNKVAEAGAMVQGMDPGPGPSEHPMTGLFATSMYKEIIEDLRSKNKALTGGGGEENSQ